MSLPPEPRANPDLFAQDAAAQLMEEAARGGRMHHAWLIGGPAGVGKATLAYRFARWLLAGMPPPVHGQAPLYLSPEDSVFRRCAAAAHADLHVLAPNTGERGVKMLIRAEEARAAVRFLAHTAAEGGWRVVLVDQADVMQREPANALLKTLEEPPPRSVLLLTTSRPDALLPTLRSRCRRLELPAWPEKTLASTLGSWLPNLSAAERGTLAGIAEGSPGRALALAEGEGLALHELVQTLLQRLPQPSPVAVQALADQVAAKRDGSSFVVFMELLRTAVQQGVRHAARGQGGDRQGGPTWLGARSLADWASLWDKLGRLAAETEQLNLDRKQAVLTGVSWLSGR